MDLRNALSKARDEFLDSLGPEYFYPAEKQFLINRFQTAFIAGWDAAEKNMKTKRVAVTSDNK